MDKAKLFKEQTEKGIGQKTKQRRSKNRWKKEQDKGESKKFKEQTEKGPKDKAKTSAWPKIFRFPFVLFLLSFSFCPLPSVLFLLSFSFCPSVINGSARKPSGRVRTTARFRQPQTYAPAGRAHFL